MIFKTPVILACVLRRIRRYDVSLTAISMGKIYEKLYHSDLLNTMDYVATHTRNQISAEDTFAEKAREPASVSRFADCTLQKHSSVLVL